MRFKATDIHKITFGLLAKYNFLSDKWLKFIFITRVTLQTMVVKLTEVPPKIHDQFSLEIIVKFSSLYT